MIFLKCAEMFLLSGYPSEQPLCDQAADERKVWEQVMPLRSRMRYSEVQMQPDVASQGMSSHTAREKEMFQPRIFNYKQGKVT